MAKCEKNVAKNPTRVGKIEKNSAVFLVQDREVTVSGCKKVVEYSDSAVVLQQSELLLTVCGENLTIKTYFGDEIRLNGRITEIKITR